MDFFENISNKQLIKFLIILTLIATGIIITVGILYSLQFNGKFSNDQSDWGTFGDFFGGTLNAFLSYISLIALLLTIILQSKELEATRKELEQSREAQQQQTKSFEAQLELLQSKEKRDLTFQMHERWNNSNMRTHRLDAWDTLTNMFAKKSDGRLNVNLHRYRIINSQSFNSFMEVCIFFSDMSKLFDRDLLDRGLSVVLFQDSVAPWFTYIDNLDFQRLAGENYNEEDLGTEEWYRGRVMSLKHIFENEHNRR